MLEREMRRYLAILLLALCAAIMLVGCNGGIFGCNEEVQKVTVLWDSGLEDWQRSVLAGYRDSGWQCQGEAIRNAWGRGIGTEYTCTRCK